MDVEPEFYLYPWKRCLSMVMDGQADAIFPPFLTEERTEFLHFPSEPVSMTRNVIFAPMESEIKIDQLDDLKNLIVGINKSYSYGPKFDEFKNIHHQLV